MEAKEPVYSRSLIKRLKIQTPIPFEAGRKAGIREVFENSLQFIVAHRETLCDVGEWAECQDVGRFLYIPKAQLKDWGID